jgi:putative ABC transport system permease protein
VVHEIGDTVSVYTTDPDDPIEDSLERTEWEVVGIVMTPQYIAYDRGTSTIGDGSADTYVMVPKENFLLEVYTEVYVTLSGTEGISAFSDEYSGVVEIASEDFEKIGEIRAPERLAEIKDEAYDEINDAKTEIADAEKELADAEKELADAYTELTDGEKEIKDGWKDYYSGLAEYNDGLKEFEGKIEKAEKKLEKADKSLEDAMLYGLQFTLKDLSKRALIIHPDALACYNEIVISNLEKGK